MSAKLELDLANFGDPSLSEAFVAYLVREEAPDRTLHFDRLWSYYRNEVTGLGSGVAEEVDESWSAGVRPYRQAQEFGLPPRITGRRPAGCDGSGLPTAALRRKEVVVENDIGWRIDTGVHFLVGRPVGIESLARRAEDARRIEAALAAVWEASGGAAMLEQAALLGAVYGFVDVVVRLRSGREAAEAVALEAVEAPRVVPVLEEDDCRRLRYWVQTFRRVTNHLAGERLLARLLRRPPARVNEVEVVEILGPRWWQRYEAGQLAAEGANPLGRLPLVHIQNLAHPMHYEGVGEVEPLIPLQDELNTRLSDRANRVTFQSFKMYLGKGIDAFLDHPVAPGRMWATDNPDASIETFGGDAACPSEDAHIDQLREAMDKVSGVTPLAAGLLRDRLGRLTSAAALKVVLMGTLARVQRKRVTYGRGLVEANRLVLEALDATGILKTDPADRGTRLHWPDPLPENTSEKLAEARAKRDLGVPAETVLRELGYDPAKP